MFIETDAKFSFSGLIGLEYATNKSVRSTIGIGYLNTGEKTSAIIGGQLGIEDVRLTYNHIYIIIPLGAKF